MIIWRCYFLCLATFGFAFAQESSQLVQDVFQSELVYPQEGGEVQFTSAPTFCHRHGDPLISNPISLEYGLTNRWQLELEWRSFVQKTRDLASGGTGDLEIGTKYSFRLARAPLAAIGISVLLPIGDEARGFGEGSWQFEPHFTLAGDLPWFRNTHVFSHISLGFSSENGSDDSPVEINFNSGWIVPFQSLRLTTEFNCSNDSQFYLTPGLIWDTPGQIEFGAGVPLGLTSSSDAFRILALFSFELSLFAED